MNHEPAMYMVVSQGTKHGPITKTQLDAWRKQDFDLLYDTTTSVLWVRRPGESLLPIDLDSSIPLTGSEMDLLRVLAENPGVNITEKIYAKFTGRILERNTVAHYARSLREIIGDDGRKPCFIKNGVVDETVSHTGRAYRANPKLRWGVIRFVTDGD